MKPVTEFQESHKGGEKTAKVLKGIFHVATSKYTIMATLALAVITGIGCGVVSGIDYVNKNEAIFQPLVVWSFKLQSPIYFKERKPNEIYVPVIIEKVSDGKPLSDLTKEDKEKIIDATAEFPKQVKKFWKLESTEGENDNPVALHNYCKSIGKTNEFGYDPYNKRCFNTFEESVQFVDALVQDLLSKYSLDEAICIYNTGKSTNCNYLANYKALK